jgi:hypothetical protein
MIYVLRKRVWRSIRLLFTACMSTFFLAVVGSSLQAQERPEPRESFIELDSEIQAIKAEILDINQEILLLEGASLYPQGDQLVILVSIATGDPMVPGRITLRLDQDTVSQHDYSGVEVTALYQGGVHRLYAGRLDEGEHRLDIALSGTLARDKDFRQEHSITVSKSRGRKFMELQLGSGKNNSSPGLTIREWQQ